MFNFWKRVVEVVKQGSPLLIFRRLPETDRMILQFVPTNQKDVSAWLLETPLDLEISINALPPLPVESGGKAIIRYR